MENITKALEKLGSTASLQAKLISGRETLMRSLGVSQQLTKAVIRNSPKEIGRLLNNRITFCCFIVVPTDISSFATGYSTALMDKENRRCSLIERSIA